MSRRALKWLVLALVVVLAAGAALRVLSARKAQQAAVAAAPRAQAVLELAAADVIAARVIELAQGLPISGSLKAVQTALVKARAAGELQGLVLREGDPVRAGQVVGRVEATEYQARMRQAQQQAEAAAAQVEIAQRQFANNRALVEQGFISRTALDTSQSSLQSAQATHRAALAATEVARKSLDDTVLRAPISGVVAQRLAQPGERVGIDSRILEIVNLGRLELEATLSPADSMRVRVGQEAVLQVEGSARAVAARVVRINPSAQAGNRNVLAYLAVSSADGLRQGLFAQGTLATGRVSALAVPLTALRTDKPAPYLQLLQDGQVAHRRVTTGDRGDAGGETMVAVEGITPGTPVLRGHLGTLREGTRVKFSDAPAGAGAEASTRAAPAGALPDAVAAPRP